MMRPRWRKVLKDLGANKIRTLLVVLSIAVGVFASGIVTSVYFLVPQDMNNDFQSANPHSGYIITTPFDDEMVATVQDIPGVLYAQGRSNYSGLVQSPLGRPVTVSLVAVPKEMKINRIFMLDGSPVPHLNKHEILIEQTGLTLLPVKAGDEISLQLPDGRTRKYTIAGIVHDPTAFSSIFSGVVNAYISPGAMEMLTGSIYYSDLRFVVSENQFDAAHVADVGQLIAEKLQKSGHLVIASVTTNPGQHPIASMVQALSLLMGGLGILAIFLSAFLVVNTIDAILTQHTRQIGVMKAVGATAGQITGMYAILVLSFGLLAFLTAVPLAALVAFVFNIGMGSFLNYTAGPLRIPTVTLIIQLIVAFGIPLGATLMPVMKSANQTVRAAISNYGLGAVSFGKGVFDKVIEGIRFLPRPQLISLRNTFRRKARLALTLSTLTLAGAIFIAVFNIQSSFDVMLEKTLGYFLSDLNVAMNQNYRVERVEELLKAVPGVVKVEPWGLMPARLMAGDQSEAIEIYLWGPPHDSTMIAPVITSGRWLLPEDQNAIVIGNHVLAKLPGLEVSDVVTVSINNRDYLFTIVGIYQMAGNVNPPFTYTGFDALNRTINTPDQAAYFRVDLAQQGLQIEKSTGDQITQVLSDHGLSVGQIQSGTESRAQQKLVTDILVYFLLFMAVLIALVGGLGLGGTMGMNVLERTREIGIMRSIGASNFSIMSMVVFEGMLIGLISWLAGAILALPISKLLCDVVGLAFLTMPMPVVFSWNGIILWLIVVVVLAGIASLLPAINAARLTVRDVLAYE